MPTAATGPSCSTTRPAGPGSPGRTSEEAAGKLAALLTQERADLLLSYDPRGGYGHRDHVRVHQVGARAAGLGADVRLVEATVPRELVARVARPLLLPSPGVPSPAG